MTNRVITNAPEENVEFYRQWIENVYRKALEDEEFCKEMDISWDEVKAYWGHGNGKAGKYGDV